MFKAVKTCAYVPRELAQWAGMHTLHARARGSIPGITSSPKQHTRTNPQAPPSMDPNQTEPKLVLMDLVKL